MSNQFLASSKKLITAHGQAMSYVSVTEGIYNIETGSTANTETTYTVTMYKKHISANQYSFPSLIGKTAAIFYLVNDSLSFIPAVQDKITFAGETFTIESLVEHRAQGAIVLYRLIAVKG
jgi:hypothetical protein